MPSVAVDSGLLVAVMAHDDRHHALALKFVKSNRAHLITNVAVLTETAYLLSFSAGAVKDVLEWVARSMDIDGETGADLPRIVDIMTKYADLPADFADASLVAMCERRGIAAIATLDHDFDVYQLGSGSTLQNVLRDVSGAAP